MINRKGSVLHLETYVTTDLEEFDAMQKTERQSKACPTIDGTSSIATDFCIVSKPLKGSEPFCYIALTSTQRVYPAGDHAT